MKSNILVTIDKKLLKTLSDEAQELFNEAIRYAASEVYSNTTGNLIEAEEVVIDKYMEFDIVVKANIGDIANSEYND